MSKKSIRFFNDRGVRAVWDDENNKWWFSVTDIVRAINDEDDYKKCRNYWKYLKGKMTKEGIEPVSVTNHFKFLAPDGKQRKADADMAESRKYECYEKYKKYRVRGLHSGPCDDRFLRRGFQSCAGGDKPH